MASSKNYLVVYLISGTPHIPYVLTSIWSLRKSGYTGPVTVFAWTESIGYIRQLERDDRLNIWASERFPEVRDGVGGNAQPLDRIKLSMSLDCDVSLYIDADSSVHRDITPMFEAADKAGYCATQWCDWVTNNGKTKSRVLELSSVESIPKDLINEVVTHRWPSLNCGIYASKPDSPLLPQWYEWTKACGKMFICDEKAQHLLMAKYPTQIAVLCGGAYNCSPSYQPSNLKDKDVVLYHYHGDCNVKKMKNEVFKSEKGYRLWWPLWQECLEKNLGGIAGWWRGCGNRHLPKLMGPDLDLIDVRNHHDVKVTQ